MSLSGCCKPVYVYPDFEIPAEQTYPTIQGEALQCLSDDAYTALVERDAMKTERIRLLRAILGEIQTQP